VKKLVIAVFVAAALPVLAAPPHERPELKHQYHEGKSFERSMQMPRSDTAIRATSTERNRASETAQSSRTPDAR
jgi:hypothetical protein